MAMAGCIMQQQTIFICQLNKKRAHPLLHKWLQQYMLYSQSAANMDENPQLHVNATAITHPGTQEQLLALQPQQML